MDMALRFLSVEIVFGKQAFNMMMHVRMLYRSKSVFQCSKVVTDAYCLLTSQLILTITRHVHGQLPKRKLAITHQWYRTEAWMMF